MNLYRTLPPLFFLVLTPLFAHGQWHGPAAPDSISFQGLLANNLGDPVDDGAYDLLFKMYKGSSVIWQQNHSNVEVQNGVFNVLLTGTGSFPLDTVAFNVPIELGISVEGGSEIEPRTPLTSAAYALGMRGMYAVWNDNGSGESYNLIGGAYNNYVAPNVTGATIAGGGGWSESSSLADSVIGSWGTISGGFSNTAFARASVGGGQTNKATGLSATIGGGASNRASGQSATVGGGTGNQATGGSATVAGGLLNEATASYATVGGGQSNQANDVWATVAGGHENLATSSAATVGGGDSNEANGSGDVIAGGAGNRTSGPQAAIAGGSFNTATGDNSIVAGGQQNRADGRESFAAGYKARAKHEGTFVWNDRSVTSGNDSLVSTAANQFIVRADGGFGIGTANPLEALHVNAGGPSAIFLGGGGSNGPHGIVFDDDSSPGNGVQIMYRAAPNQLVIEASSGGTGSNPVDAFFFDRDDFNFGFLGVVRPISDDAFTLGTSSFRWTDVYATSGVVNSSDARLKRDIASIDHALDQVMDLRPVRFRWRKTPNGDLNLGLIAQEVESVAPEVVTPPATDDAYYGLNYAELVPLLIRAIQEQNEAIEQLESENEEFRTRLDSIEYASTR